MKGAIATPTLGSAAAPAAAAATDVPPPEPALKLLELIPAIVVETTVTSGAPVGDGPTRLTALTFDPPTPTLKPLALFSPSRSVLMSSPDDQPPAGEAARGRQSLPDGLRPLGSNLKILLPSGPASGVGAVGDRGGEGGLPG